VKNILPPLSSGTQTKLYPRTTLALLTALNLFNFIDRSVLFAVQEKIKAEFHASDTALGFLSTVFFVFYMCTAPFMALLARKFSRKPVIIVGALVWSGATLLTAATHSFTGLLVRHTLVGVGEASFVILSPTVVADMFPETQRGASWSVLLGHPGWHSPRIRSGRISRAPLRLACTLLCWRSARGRAGPGAAPRSGAATRKI